jgi:hypothetical protein
MTAPHFDRDCVLCGDGELPAHVVVYVRSNHRERIGGCGGDEQGPRGWIAKQRHGCDGSESANRPKGEALGTGVRVQLGFFLLCITSVVDRP